MDHKIERSKAAFFRRATEFLGENGIDPQTVDLESEFDDHMLASENMQTFQNKMVETGMVKPKMNIAQIEEDQKISDLLAEKTLQKQLAGVKLPNKIRDFYQDIYEMTEKMKMELAHLGFVKGIAGIGKTHHIKIAAAKQGFKVVIAKKVSEPYLYRLLFENNDPNVLIWIQDAARFFRQQEMIEFLKGVTETDPADRIATNYTYSKDNDDLPKSFIWRGKLLFDYNNMVNLKFLDDYNALISRGEFLELVFSRDEMAKIMRSVAKTKTEKQVTEFLIGNHKFVNNNHFNLRLQQQMFLEYEYATRKKLDWKKYLMRKLGKNKTPIQSMLYQCMGDHAISRTDLIQWLVRSNNAGSERTAARKIDEWLRMEEIYNISGTSYNPVLSLRSKEQFENEGYIG